MPIINLADCPPRQWQNGLGRTRELAIHPPSAGMADFLWRISVAEVDAAAPFSTFPGVDRVIALLDGAGFTMQLDDGRVHALTTPCQPFAFPGETGVTVSLAGSPNRDFNLMLRRGRAQGSISALHGPGQHAVDATTVLVYCARGVLHTAEGRLHAGQAWLPGQADFRLAADSTVLQVRVHLSA